MNLIEIIFRDSLAHLRGLLSQLLGHEAISIDSVLEGSCQELIMSNDQRPRRHVDALHGLLGKITNGVTDVDVVEDLR